MFKPFEKRDLSKSVITNIPFVELAENCTAANYEKYTETWCTTNGLKFKSWVYPQVLAHVSKWTLSRNSSGKFSGKSLVVENCKNNAFNKGIYWFLMTNHRKALDKQYLQGDYCSLVPPILSAFKKNHSIDYKEWDVNELNFVVPSNLLEAMGTVPPKYSLEELLQFRTRGLTVASVSSKNHGEVKSAVTTFNLNGLAKELEDGRVGLGSFNSLVRMILCQTWCAHPKNRNRYMILDLEDWDRMPEPLIDEEIITKTNNTKWQSDLDELWK